MCAVFWQLGSLRLDTPVCKIDCLNRIVANSMCGRNHLISEAVAVELLLRDHMHGWPLERIGKGDGRPAAKANALDGCSAFNADWMQ